MGWAREVFGMAAMACADEEWVTPDVTPRVLGVE
jgi:hypothetical protein